MVTAPSDPGKSCSTAWVDHEIGSSKTKVIASTGRHQTCLPSWRKESSARVYARCISSEIFWGLKDKNFLGRHLYTRQLACEPQTGKLAYFSVAVRNGKKKTTSSLDRSSTSCNMQVAAFAVPL